MLVETSLYEETDFCPSQESLEGWNTCTFKVLLYYFSKVIVLKTDKNAHTNCDIVLLKLRTSFLYENETFY